jgi:HlyD family secretion protein
VSRAVIARFGIALALAGVLFAGVRAVVVRGATASPEPRYETARVERGNVVSSVSATGTLQPLTTVEVKSDVGGRIDQLPVELGQYVKKGQLIAAIDPTDPRTQLEQAQARHRAAQAKVSQAELNLALQRTQSAGQIAQAEQQLAAAKARMRQAESQYRAQPALTRASIDQAKANLTSAEQALKQLESATIPQAKTAAQSDDRQTAAALEEARKNRDRQQELFERGFVPQKSVEAAAEPPPSSPLPRPRR